MRLWNWFAIAIVALLFLMAACDDDGDGDGDPDATAAPTATVAAGGGSDEPDGDGGATGPFASFAGTYEGTWTNDTFATTADVTIEIAFDGATATFTLTLEEGPDGSPFGATPPPPKVLEGTVDATGIAVELLGDDFFGDLTVLISDDGAIAAVASMDGVDGVTGLSADGAITESGIELTYTVTLQDGTEASGTATLERT